MPVFLFVFFSIQNRAFVFWGQSGVNLSFIALEYICLRQCYSRAGVFCWGGYYWL